MAILFSRNSFKGWRPWETVPTTVFIKNPDPKIASQIRFDLPFANMPSTLLPASKLMLESIVVTSVPSATATDNTATILSLAATGVVGAVAASAIAALNTDGIEAYALGAKYPPLTTAFCVGDKYSERVYYSLVIAGFSSFGANLVTKTGTDVIQKYNLTRFYLHHGEIIGVSTLTNGLSAGETALNLGINNRFNPKITIPVGMSGKIIKKNGLSVSFTVKRFLPNFNAVIDTLKTPITNGDFYLLDKMYCIEDPYLMSGIYNGLEDETYRLKRTKEPTKSGLNTFLTSNNLGYIDTFFSAGYALKSTDDKLLSANVGMSMNDTLTTTWQVFFTKNESKTYTGQVVKKRFKQTTEYRESTAGVGNTNLDNSADISVNDYVRYAPVYDLMKECTEDDVLQGLKTSSHLRLELAKGGNETLNNFHAPILKNEYIIQDNKYFKILDHIDGIIIDVSCKSVDGTATLDINGPVKIVNQYAWKIARHLMSNGLQLHGRVSSVSNNEVTVIFSERDDENNTSRITGGTTANIDVIVGDGDGTTASGFKYMDKNSFLWRFLNTFPHESQPSPGMLYVKGDGWAIEKQDKTRQLTSTSIEYLTNTDGIHTVKFNIGYAVDGIAVGEFVDVSFDYVANGEKGIANVDASSAGELTFLDGSYWSNVVEQSLNSKVVVGVCDNIFWGGGTVLNSNPIFKMTTPEGLVSISSVTGTVPICDSILYKDFFTGKATVRHGFMDCTDRPIKQEIAFGTRVQQPIGTSGSAMDKQQERLSGVIVKDLATMSDDATDAYVTFSIGSKSEMFGFPISGKGRIDLQPFRITGEQETIENETFQYDGNVISPVFIYKNGVLNQNKNTYVPLGIETSKGSIFINDGFGSKDAKGTMDGLYNNENQTINASGGMDMFLLQDGEHLMIYSKLIDYDFKIDGILNGKGWQYSDSAIMAVSSQNFGASWGLPFLSQGINPLNKALADPSGATHFPIMLAYACEYQCGLYDRFSNTLFLFAKCYNTDGVPFLGLFKLNVYSLFDSIHLGVHAGITSNDVLTILKPETFKKFDAPFLYRPLNLPSEVTSSDLRHFTSKKNTVVSSTSTKTAFPTDNFMRVMGNSKTNANVFETETSWGTISCKKLSTGHFILFYDSPIGIKFLYSNTSGATWVKSDLIVSRNGKCGFMIDDEYIFYLVPGKGVCFKKIAYSEIQNFIKLTVDRIAGKTGAKEEIEGLQKMLNSAKEFEIGTGVVDEQRFTGYKTQSGLYKVFYYDALGKISCAQSADRSIWSSAQNF